MKVTIKIEGEQGEGKSRLAVKFLRILEAYHVHESLISTKNKGGRFKPEFKNGEEVSK